ncbi:MAG: hypothetical protein ACLSTO_09900 [Bilophila wadsworthia]
MVGVVFTRDCVNRTGYSRRGDVAAGFGLSVLGDDSRCLATFFDGVDGKKLGEQFSLPLFT